MPQLVLDEQSKSLASSLVLDIFESMNALMANNASQYARRTYIRTFLSFVEGFARVLRRAILDSGQLPTLPSEWKAILEDQKYEPGATGKPEATEARHRFRNLFAATLRAWALLEGKSEDQITSEIFGINGWHQFKKAVDIRDDLMHPKIGKSLDVDDDQLVVCIEAAKWFAKISATLIGLPLKEIDAILNWKPEKK
jgi:hypothetical protein